MRRQTTLLLAGFVVCVAGSGSFLLCISRDDAIVVRLKWLHQAQFAGFYVAHAKGLYAAEGIDVRFRPGGVELSPILQVAAGEEQFGVTGADQILLARSRDAPVVAIAVIYRANPMVFFAMADAGIKKPADFVGRRVGVKHGGNEELIYRALLAATGVDKERIEEVPVRYDMTPFFDRRVDVWPGYAINEVIVARERGFDVVVIEPSAFGVKMYADTIFTTERMLAEKPDLVEGFLRATIRGWQIAAADMEAALESTLMFDSRLDRNHERRMMEASLSFLKPDGRPIGWMDSEGWAAVHDALLEDGLLAEPLDVERAFSTGALQRIGVTEASDRSARP